MAVLKDLIVHGPSRFLNGASFNTINAESIGAEQGIFNKLIATTLDAKEATIDNLTAQNATVVGLLDVQGELHTNAWTNANIANIGGSFYISPTVEPTDGTTTISITRNSATSWTVSASGTFATDFIKSGTATSGVAWPANSLVLITGDIVLGDMVYPLGTLKGTLNSQVTATAATTSKTITITGVTDAQNNNSPSVLQELYELNGNANISNATYKNGKISLYKLGSNPIGILLSSMGSNSNSIIDIYGGVSTNPTVRIGHLAGLPNINGSAPTGWGIYTDNGYFSGVIVSTSGKIGGWTLGTSAIYNNTNSKTSTTAGTYLGIDAIRNYNSLTQYVHIEGGKITAQGADITGEIKADTGRIGGSSGWTIASQQIYSGSIGTDNSMYLSTKNLAGTVAGTTLTTTAPSWRLTVGSNFGVDNTGKLYASGAKISGDLTASSLSTGGRTSSTAAAGTYIDAYGAIYGGNNKFTVTKEGALTAEGAVLNNLYFKDQYKIYGFLGWTTSESSGLIGSYEITSDWYEEHARDSTLVLTYAYTNSFSSPFILKKNGDIIPTSTNYYQISTSISINTVTVTINLTTVGVDDGDEFSVYATNKNNTHYYIALNGYDNFYKYGQGSFSCGESCEASGIFSTAIGRSVKVTGIGSFGQGREHKVTGPYCSATGVNNTVNTYFSHAEGGYNLIDEEANVAHAEGWHTTITADGNGAHTEGGYTTATAQSAHAEGDYTLASGAESHAGGYYTIAQGMCQTVIGAFNKAIGTPNSVSDRTVPVFIIGNGTGTSEDSRSNALTVDWAGNVKASGDITANNIGVMLYHLPAATSCTSGRWFQVAYLTLTPGVWLLDCNAQFLQTNTTGTRQIRVSTVTSGYDNVTTAPASYGNIAIDILVGANTTQYPQVHFPVEVSANQTFRLIAYQGSGSTINVQGRMYATRIK